MQGVEEFMGEYFAARTEQIRKEVENLQPHRRKYFTNDCAWDSRQNLVEQSAGETILGVVEHEKGASVITQPKVLPQLRYHLVKSTDSWLIRKVDLECYLCKGVGGYTECVLCRGSGWTEPEKELDRVKSFFDPESRPVPGARS
jgi:hypothetical protein